VIVLASMIAAVAADPAGAGTVTIPNACLYSFNAEYRNQQVTLSGVGSPLGASPGTVVTLSGTSLSAQLPTALPEQGYELGVFQAGFNEVPAKVWVALAATNATPATQVRELSVTASTTITVAGGPGSEFVSGTPIVVSIPIPDTTWTVSGAGQVTFAQAGPGTLPGLPVGPSDKVQAVTGSIVVKPQLGSLRFVLDCQPGVTEPPYKTFTATGAAPFATLESQYVLPAPPPPTPAAQPKPKLRVASTKLKRRDGRIAIAIACPPGTAPCKGRLSARTLSRVRIGRKRRYVKLIPTTSYTVAAGRQRTVRVKLSADARRLLRTRRSVRVRVTLDPSRGANVARTLTLDR